jgi:hypothetical protein
MKLTTTARTVITLVFSLLSQTSIAGDAPYSGTWGMHSAQCQLAQDAEGAPYVFSKDGYNQHEAHCSFKSVTPEGPAFKIAAECSVEGDTQPQDFTITVSGNTLTWSDGTGALELIRCK